MSGLRARFESGDPWEAKGVWRGCSVPDNPSRRTAIVSCPGCGQSASLSDHTIGANGDVEPSLVCPAKGCSFHEHVTLVGWRRENAP